MDPNVCWQRILEIMQRQHVTRNERDEVCELLEALAGWIGKGGFLPHRGVAAREGDPYAANQCPSL